MTACEIPVQRHEMIEAMRGLGLKGMAGAFDEAVTAGVQRQRTITEILTICCAPRPRIAMPPRSATG